MARDWPADLWSTSFNGVPFWVRKVESEFGRRLQKDEFPERDDPFVQDLGGALRTEQIDAYLVGDTSDAEAQAFVDALIAAGQGTLVLPDQGPVPAWFEKGRRAYELDRQGFVGLSLTFVRAASGAIGVVSVDFLGQLVSDAAGAAVAGVAALAAQVVLS